MRELPVVLADTRRDALATMPTEVPLLTALATRLDALLPGEAAALADAMLERTYLGLRVLAVVPGALSPHGFLSLFAFHDILGGVVTGRLDSEIARSFPEVTLVPISLIAGAMQSQADAMQQAAKHYEHPLYGDVATDDAVRLE